MEAGCPGCGGVPVIGVLCEACRAPVAPCDGLVPGHITSKPRSGVAAWLVDAFGAPHAVSAARTTVGRRPEADLVVLNDSVSRDHAELHRGDDGWQLRDLGSRNGTFVDGRRVQARVVLVDRAPIKFGEVAFVFIARPVAMPARGHGSVDTRHAGRGTFRFTLRGDAVELCLVGSDGDDADSGGALLYRARGGATWAEVSLPPLEFQLLRMLCARAIEDQASPSRARGCVPTKQLVKGLPFQSKYPNEENVRQVVRRVRTSLGGIGADGLLEAQPGRGYFVAWPVIAG